MRLLLRVVFVALLCSLSVHSVKIELENLPERCDFTKCVKPDPTKLNVHLVPHTHDDVGWLKTVDQYYYGTNNRHQKAGVQYILDSVVEELIRGKDRRFIYVETAFFWRWWQEQNDEQRAIVHELVRNGQLEFINGGWSMNDEATTHYNSIIDQMTWGLRRLNDTFGKCGVPKVAWQIDPFGHSREQANLFAQMNFDAVYFARQDYQEKTHRIQTNTLEHIWQGSDDLGIGGDLFTGMMKNHYGPLPGLHWDLSNDRGDEPIIDNPESEEFNVPHMVEQFVQNAKNFQHGYPTNNVMVPMGNDFHYQNARVYFKNMDKLIRAVNNRSSEVKVFYSTPSCYTKALHESGKTFSSKSDDFFPYASDQHSYWTGYFTSRPSVKRFERVGNNLLQICKQIDVLAGNGGQYEKEVTKLREMMGVMQHHDAVTGTEKQHVTDDYNKNLQIAIEGCRSVISQSYEKLLASKHGIPPVVEQNYCDYLNISSCAFTENGQSVVVTVYNPLGHTLTNRTVRIPVQENTPYRVFDAAQKPVVSYLVAVPQGVQDIPEAKTESKVELVFTVDSVPPLGLVSYFVRSGNAITTGTVAKEVKGQKIAAAGVKLQSKDFDLLFDATGEVSQIQLKDGSKIAFKSEFHYYKGASDSSRNSGAYVFRPAEQQSHKAAKVVSAELFQDGTVQEVHQKFDVDYISQVVRVNEAADAVEFEWVLGPIPVRDNVGKEIVARYSTNLNSQHTFYTDANGRQMLQRVVNHRASWKLQVHEQVSGNYYPINSRIYLRDEKRGLQLTVHSDRTQGGTSLQNGSLELMVHRRLLHDDHFGVSEPLNEPGVDGTGLVIRGRHLVQLSAIKDAASKHRAFGQQLFMEPLISFGQYGQEYTNKYATKFQGLTADLPANIHLLTLEEWNHGQLLLRLEHFYQKGEDTELSKPVTLNLKNLFAHYEVTSAQELTLSANADISTSAQRLQFKYTPVGKVDTVETVKFNPTTLTVTLNPMQIRTFAVRVRKT